MKTFVTFGQVHRHEINGKVFDKDCVAVIHHELPEEGRKLAFKYFDRKFCFEYPEEHFDALEMEWYPRGLIYVNGDSNE